MLITTLFLIAVSIYCYLIKYKTEFVIDMGSNDKLKETDIENCKRYYFDDIIKFVDFNRDNVYDETRYLVLFGAEWYDFIYHRIEYLIGIKSDITYVVSHNYAKIKGDPYNSLPLEKTLTFYVIIHIRSVCNKDQNHYYYNIFLEICSYQLKKLKITISYKCCIMIELTHLKKLILIKRLSLLIAFR